MAKKMMYVGNEEELKRILSEGIVGVMTAGEFSRVPTEREKELMGIISNPNSTPAERTEAERLLKIELEKRNEEFFGRQ